MNILPSLLSASPLHLEKDLVLLQQGGYSLLHIDIMDGHYVPNLTFGVHFLKAIHQAYPLFEFDVHFMTNNVDMFIEQFSPVPMKRIAIHPNTTHHLDRSLSLIQSKNAAAGIVLNPADTIDVLTYCLHRIQYVLIMTVNPGFGGQSLIEAVLPKITAIKTQFPNLPIVVDGGVTLKNMSHLHSLGISECVVGAGLFQSELTLQTLNAFQERMQLLKKT